MGDLLRQLGEMDPGTRASIMLAVAGILVALLRKLGLQLAPGVVSVLAAMLLGAAAGALTGGWQGALLGAVAGLGATGAHQLGVQARKARNGG